MRRNNTVINDSKTNKEILNRLQSIASICLYDKWDKSIIEIDNELLIVIRKHYEEKLREERK